MKPFPLLAATLCAATLVAACGSDDETTTASRDAAPTATETGGNPTACVEGEASGDLFPDKVTVDEATAFTVRYEDTYKVVTNSRPSPASKEKLTYVLVQCGTKAPELSGDLAGATVVEVPVKKVVTMSTTYLPSLEALESLDVLAAVDSIDFVSNRSVQDKAKAGGLQQVGNGAQANLELLASIKSDMVMTQATGDESADGIGRMKDAGADVVINSDWLEETPLGRAEWVKFISLFVNAEKTANETFDDISTKYRDLAEKAAAAKTRPLTLMNAPYEGTWFVPGGASFTVRLLKDAGANYAFADDTGTGGKPLDFEAVFASAGKADVWLANDVNFTTMNAAKAADPRFANFAAFASGNVWNNDRKVTPKGGNDYYETTALRADLLLGDLVAIFHPDLAPGHTFTWYRKVPAS